MPLQTPTTFNASNVLHGSQKLYVAPYGTPFDQTVIAPGSTNVITLNNAFTSVGYTSAGYTVEYSPTYKNIMVDEAMSPITVLKTAEELKITANLSEATLENMLAAISGSTFTDATAAGAGVAEIARLTVGGSQSFNYFTAVFVGTGAYGLPRLFHVFKGFQTAKVSMAFKKDSEILIPVEFTGLADTAQPIGSQLFEIYEKRANSTS